MARTRTQNVMAAQWHPNGGALGNVVFRIKAGDPAAAVPIAYTTLATLTVLPTAGVRTLHWNVDMGANGFDNWRIQWIMGDGSAAGSAAVPALTSATYAVNADQNIIVTAEVVNAGDTCAVWMYEVEQLGW